MQRNLSGFEHSVNTCYLCYGDGCDSALYREISSTNITVRGIS